MVPRIVPEDQLSQANSVNATTESIARLAGAPLGGVAVAAGGLSAVVVADGVTLLAVALATLSVRTPTATLNPVDSDGGTHVGVRDGWKAIRGSQTLVGYLGVQALASAAFAMFSVLFISFVIDVLDGNEATIGIIR